MIKIHQGIILAVNGTNPGPASGITYDVEVDLNGGAFRMDGTIPTHGRFPDELNTVAAPVGSIVTVAERGGSLYLLPPGETIEVEVCEEPAP